MSKPVKKQSWSNIDAFGLIRGLGVWDSQYKRLQYVRRPFDTSIDIRDKIFRLNDDPPGLTKQGLLNGISDEFGLVPYNVTKKTIFNLTYNPIPSGNLTTQDIFVQCRALGSSGTWSDIRPQLWGDTYEQGKTNSQGFIVWPQSHFNSLSGYKNFSYSNSLEILEDLADEQEIRISYYVSYVDENNVQQTVLYTDMDNLSDKNDRRYLYRKPIEISPLSGVIAYSLNDIPSNLYSRYYTTDGRATEKLYKIQQHFDKIYRHTWDKLANRTTIWDIVDIFGSGAIPHFLDSYIPKTDNHCLAATPYFSGYLGGNDYVSNAIYLADLFEMETDAQEWYPQVYPGRFYIDGIPYRLFNNPKISGLVFTNGVADLPSGLGRGMYTVLAKRGYFENGCTDPDEFLSGFIYEDYWAPCGKGGDQLWGNVYRRRPFLSAEEGYQVDLELGQYNIDFKAGKIYLNSYFTSGTLIWDADIQPSGKLIRYDVNPLNQAAINLQRFFIYLVNKE